MPQNILPGANSATIPVDSVFDPETGVEDIAFSARDISDYFNLFFSDGMDWRVEDNADISISSGMIVQIEPYAVFIDGTRAFKRTGTSLTFEEGDAQNRIDSIIIRRDLENRISNILIKKGIPSATPQPPTLTYERGNVCEIALYNVLIPAQAAALVITNITDNRVNMALNESLRIALQNMPIWRGTQAEYDSIEVKNEGTIYLIIGRDEKISAIDADNLLQEVINPAANTWITINQSGFLLCLMGNPSQANNFVYLRNAGSAGPGIPLLKAYLSGQKSFAHIPVKAGQQLMFTAADGDNAIRVFRMQN